MMRDKGIRNRQRLLSVLFSMVMVLGTFGIVLINVFASGDFTITSSKGGSVETISKGSLMFSDNEDFKFDNPPNNLMGVSYVKTTKSGDSLTAQGAGWVYVLTTSYGHAKSQLFSQKENLFLDGFTEENFEFAHNFCLKHGKDAPASYEANISIYAPFGIYSKYVNDGAKITIKDFSVVLFSKEKIDFDATVMANGGDEVKEAAIGGKIWRDQEFVFSENLPKALIGQKYIQSLKASSWSTSLKSGYVFALATGSALTGYTKVNIDSFELYSGSAEYNVFYKTVSLAGEETKITAAGIVQFFTSDFLSFGQSFEISNDNLAIVRASENANVLEVKNGGKMFQDRDFIFSALPNSTKHLHFAQGYMDANTSNKKVDIEVLSDGEVYAIANTNNSSQLTSQGFKLVAPMKRLNVNTENVFLYSKSALGGEKCSITAKWAILLFSNAPPAENQDMAVIQGNNNRIMPVETNARIYSNRHFFMEEDMPTWLKGKSFLQTEYDMGGVFEVESAGNIYLLINNGVNVPDGFEKVNYPQFSLSFSSVMLNTKLYVKYCSKGEIVSYSATTVPVFATIANESYDIPPAMQPAYVLNLAVNENAHLREKYDTQDRDFQGCPTIAVTRGGRYFYGMFTGGPHEPYPENHGIVMLGDETGRKLAWDPLLIIDHSIKGNSGVRVEDVQLWIQPDTGYLWIFWTNSGCIAEEDWRNGEVWNNFDHSLGVWASVIKNPDEADVANLEWTAPRRVSDGLMRNKPTVLSSGEVLICAYDAMDNAWAKVYTCSDINAWTEDEKKGEWKVKGKVYAPMNSVFDEHQLVELENGTLWMLMRADKGISQSFSYDGGSNWSHAELVPHLKGGNSRFYFAKLPNNPSIGFNGEILFINHMPPTGVNRSHISAMLLDEKGNIIGNKQLMLDERNSISYPDVQIRDNGEIWVVYDRERSGAMEMLLSVFTVKDIEDGAFNSANSVQKHILSKSYKNSPINVNESNLAIVGEDLIINANLNYRKFESLSYFDGTSFVELENSDRKYGFINDKLIIYSTYLSSLGAGEYEFAINASLYSGEITQIQIDISLIDKVSSEDFSFEMKPDEKEKFLYQTSSLGNGVFDFVKDQSRDVLKISNPTREWNHDSFSLKDCYIGDAVIEATFRRDAKDWNRNGYPLLVLRKTNPNVTQEQIGGGIAFAILKEGRLIIYDTNSSAYLYNLALPQGLYKDNQYNTLKVIAEGKHFAVYLNNQYVATYTHNSNVIGKFGYVGMASSNTTVYIDSLKVTQFSEKTLKISDSTKYYDFKEESQLNDFESYYMQNSNANSVKDPSVIGTGGRWGIDTVQGRIYRKAQITTENQFSNITSLILKDLYLANFDLSIDYKRNTSDNNANWLTVVGRQREKGALGENSGFVAFSQREGIATFRNGTSGKFLSQNIENYIDTDWHNLRVVCVGMEYKVYVDQVLCVSYFGKDHDALAGYLGLQSRNNTGAYSNLMITALDINGNPIAINDNNPRIKVAAVGDSITYGVGARDDYANFLIDQNYPSQLTDMLGDAFDVRNFGISGRRVTSSVNSPSASVGSDSYFREEEYRAALKYNPDFALIMMGTNDAKDIFWNDNSAEEYVTLYKNMIQEFRTKNSDVKIIVMTSPSLYTSEQSGMPPSRVKDVIVPLQKRIAEETESALIDIFTLTSDMKDNFYDLIHPDIETYTLIAQVVVEKIMEISVGGIDLTSRLSLKVGEKSVIEYSLDNELLQGLSPLWTSSDESVASVDSFGVVTAHKAGTVTIRAYFGEQSADCSITVSKNSLPPITVQTASGEYVYGDKMPHIFSDSALGTVRFKDGQSLKAGTNVYEWVFTPFDTDYYNEVGGAVTIVVAKAVPHFTPPILNVTKGDGMTLKDIADKLPAGYNWSDSSQLITKSGLYTAIYSSDEGVNFQDMSVQIYIQLEENSNQQIQEPYKLPLVIVSVIAGVAVLGSVLAIGFIVFSYRKSKRSSIK